MIEDVPVVLACEAAMRARGLTPRDLAVATGIHSTGLYRIFSGRRATSTHALTSLRIATKFLKWLGQESSVRDSPETADERTQRVAEAFEKWLSQD